ncbi:peptidoglycan DD-metalloendopeptidase family protein [Paenibacillus marinisediminis]
MSEQNQNSKQTNKSTTSSSNTNTPEASKLAGASAVPTSGWRKLLSKKWVFPALYIAAAALILTLVWVYQNEQTTTNPNPGAVQTEGKANTGNGTTDEKVVEVVANNETLGWPVANAADVEVVMGFFDASASVEEQEKAMVEYKNTFTANSGIDLARKDKKEFDVLAAMSGKVTRAEAHPTQGNVIEIDHGNGMKTVYQSVTDMKVKKGDVVSKGDAIAKAGRSELKKDFGVHVHFGVFEDNKPVNPSTLLAKN